GELPVRADKQRYLQAAAAFEGVAQPRDSWLAFDAAVRQWPEETVGWMGRGNASYRQGDRPAAATDYRAALNVDGTQAAARNNLAMTLFELGCTTEAKQQLSQIDATKLDGRLKEEVADTQRQIEAGASSGKCALP
ncbi:MAG TPA: hypothetical protein VN645_03245, partial [Steroidobacteraceae bacterium]|nr:hypothetical protein [Steroidobacteraceae bacterium]